MHKKYKEQLKDGPDMKRIYKLLAEAGIWTALSEKLLVIASKFTVCDWLLVIINQKKEIQKIVINLNILSNWIKFGYKQLITISSMIKRLKYQIELIFKQFNSFN